MLDFRGVIYISTIIIINHSPPIKCQVPSIDTCPNIQGTPQVTLPDLVSQIHIYIQLNHNFRFINLTR